MAADYKTKYLDMRAKLLEATDTAYRLGFEEGMKEGQQAAQQQQMEMEAQAAAMGQPGVEGGMPPEMGGGEEMSPEMGGAPAPEEMGGEEEGSELDSQISELENLVSKGEKPSVLTMRKAVEKLSTIRKTQKDTWSKKRQKTVSTQKKLVDNILNKWENESKSVTENLEDIIKEHGIKVD